LRRIKEAADKPKLMCVFLCVLMLITENNTMLLVMEFVSNGCLRDYLKKNNKTSPDELLRFGFEIVEVLPLLSSWPNGC